MPVTNTTDTETLSFRCTIKRMFKNCPKPDGWFGCFAHVRNEGDIKLTGKTTVMLVDDMVLDVKAVEKAEGEYDATEISVVTKTTQGLVAYLASMPGISRYVASSIVLYADINHIDVIETIKKGKNEITNAFTNMAFSLSDKQMDALVKGVSQLGIKNQLMQFLPELAGNVKFIERICQMFPEDTIDIIKEDPYCLMSVQGIPFKTVDTIAMRLGVDAFSYTRLGKNLEHLLTNDSSGDLYINLSDDNEYGKLYRDVQSKLHVKYTGYQDFGKRLKEAIDSLEFNLYIDEYNGENHLYTKTIFNAMNHVVGEIKAAANRSSAARTKFASDADAIRCIKDTINDYEIAVSNVKGIAFQLVPEQRTAIENSILKRVSIITGGPGRGKTSMIDCLAYCWTRAVKGSVLLLAPTGKAMNKLRNDTGIVQNFKYDTKTVDSLIATIEKGKEWCKAHSKQYVNAFNTSSSLIIVDESSMLDIEKVSRLFYAMPRCQFCFVGDADQLPPISPGAFFKDVIEAKLPHIPVSYLVTPLRNSGTILSNAEKVNQNDIKLDYNVTDMPFYPIAGDGQDTLDLILETYNDEREENPDITQIALLCPVKKGTIGSDNINMSIQDIVCPENKTPNMTKDKRRNCTVTTTKGYPIPDTIFGNSEKYTRIRIGDIIMNTKNQTDVETVKYTQDDYWNGNPVEGSLSVGIFNGDCGRVIAYIPAADPMSDDKSLSHSFMVIQFFDNRFVKLDITSGDADNIQLGYAMTVHKAQGCEYDSVIYVSPERMLSFGINGFLSKNLVYTAFTRAKKKVTVIGSKESLNLCIQSNIPQKNSNFKERLTSSQSYFVSWTDDEDDNN